MNYLINSVLDQLLHRAISFKILLGVVCLILVGYIAFGQDFRPQTFTLTTNMKPSVGTVVEIGADQKGGKQVRVEWSSGGEASIFTVMGNPDLVGVGSRINFWGNQNSNAGVLLQVNSALGGSLTSGVALVGLHNSSGKYASDVNFGLVSNGLSNGLMTAGDVYYTLDRLTVGVGAGCVNRNCVGEADISFAIKKDRFNIEFNSKFSATKPVHLVGIQFKF